MKKYPETLAITMFIVGGIGYAFFITLDPTSDHTIATAIWSLFLGIMIWYINEKYKTDTKNKGENNSYPEDYQQVRPANEKMKMPPAASITFLILLVIIIDNLMFSGFQYTANKFISSAPEYYELVLVFGGCILFTSILPIFAIGSMVIGFSHRPIYLREVLMSALFTFGMTFVFASLNPAARELLPMINLFGSDGSINNNGLMLKLLSASASFILMTAMSIWIWMWSRFGYWRFRRNYVIVK